VLGLLNAAPAPNPSLKKVCLLNISMNTALGHSKLSDFVQAVITFVAVKLNLALSGHQEQKYT
jgi:hypothetical protein